MKTDTAHALGTLPRTRKRRASSRSASMPPPGTPPA